jgi:hypothetical protein
VSVEPEERSEKSVRRARTRPAGVARWVDQRGQISLAGFAYSVGPVFAGEHVEVVAAEGSLLPAPSARNLTAPKYNVTQASCNPLTFILVIVLQDATSTDAVKGNEPHDDVDHR